jgi:hypothetical protein
MLNPQGLRVRVPWVRGTSPGPKYPQYPCGYVAEFFWDEETPKTQILWYFSLFLRDMMRVMAFKIREKCSGHS